ncbi:MAG: hypothetical protein ACREKH_10450, partial [Candidatus Rokuibacteriota bacterium]
MTGVLALCTLLILPASAWAVLYGANGAQGNPSSLLIINPATGAVTSTVGPIGFALTGLAVHPLTGVLYGSTAMLDATAPRSLVQVDKVTGQGTLIGSFGVPSHTMADLTFGPDGTLYGWAEASLDDLHTINLTTGQATRVGESGVGFNTRGSGIAATADAIYLAGDEGSGRFHLVDRTTGAATVVAFLNGRPRMAIAALTFGPSGVLFGVGLPIDSGPILLTIDPATGNVTEVGATADFLDAIAFDPPAFPASVAVPVPTLSEAAFAVMALLLTA